MRNPQNRIKSWTGTVHFADRGAIACGPVKTSAAFLSWTTEDVTCKKCIAMFGSDDCTGNGDQEPTHYADDHAKRRAMERAARRAAR